MKSNSTLTEEYRETAEDRPEAGILEDVSITASRKDVAGRHEVTEKVAGKIRLSEVEANYLASEIVRMDISCVSAINYAQQQNGIPVIRYIRIKNDSNGDINNAKLRITSSPAFIKNFQRESVSYPRRNGSN